MSEPPKANTVESLQFLKRWCAATGSSPVLSAAHVDPGTGKKGTFETRSFRPEREGDDIDWQAVMQWIGARQGRANLYFSVNPVHTRVDQNGRQLKSERTDVERVAALHVDVDVRVGESQEDGTARILNTFDHYKTPPSLIVSSGGGAQAFWLLDDPIHIGGDLARAEEAKLYNVQIERDLQGDHCHNIDRIMRLPGTINVPDERKRRKGRLPALARVLKFDESIVYPLDAFVKAQPEQESAPGRAVRREPMAGGIDIGADRLGVPLDDPRLATLAPKWRRLGMEGDTDGTYGGDRSRACLAFAVQCVRAEIPDDVIADCLMDPAWKIGACVRDKGRNVARDLRRTIERAHEFAFDRELASMNEAHHVVMLGGKVMILHWDDDDELYPGRPVPEYWTPEEFKKFYNKWSHQYTTKDDKGGDKEVSVPKGDWWWGCAHRRQYAGVTYAPGTDEETVNGRLNLWRGFTVQPTEGSKHARFLEHVRENICGGDERVYHYVIGWLALLVQRPHERGEVAIVLRGERGVGKTFFVDAIGALFGRHYVTVVNPEHLTGKFNPHLQDCTLLNADECIYAGDRKHEQILKALITGKTIRIEPKGVNSFEVQNHLHIIMSTNNPHSVPAGDHERRFLALHVAPNRIQDTTFFNEVAQSMREGGLANLLHMLLNVDVSNFDVRRVPSTEELDQQKSLSRKGVDAMVEQLCRDGVLPHSRSEHPEVALTVGARNDKGFFEWAMDRYPELRYKGPNGIGRALSEWGAVPWRYPRRGLRGLRFPPLAQLRATFAERCGPQRWPDDATAWEAIEEERGGDDRIPF